MRRVVPTLKVVATLRVGNLEKSNKQYSISNSQQKP